MSLRRNERKDVIEMPWGEQEITRFTSDLYLEKSQKKISQSRIEYRCPTCLESKDLASCKYKKKKYPYCRTCYDKSPERKITAKKIVENRPNSSGENNPNFRRKTLKKLCKCGTEFDIKGYQQKFRLNAKYCSMKCKYQYSVSYQKIIIYDGIKMRSSWEVVFAEHLDSLNLSWIYEPEAFETPFGFYTPDFWVSEWESYVEVKGYFRDDAKNKFDFFEKNNPIILADKNYFENLGYELTKKGLRLA